MEEYKSNTSSSLESCNSNAICSLRKYSNLNLYKLLLAYINIDSVEGIILPSKWENLSRYCTKYNTCLQKTTTCIGLRAEEIFSVNIYQYMLTYTYFSILGVAFKVPFLYYFQKLQLLVKKEFWTNFCYVLLLYLWAQIVCLRFLFFFFKL